MSLASLSISVFSLSHPCLVSVSFLFCPCFVPVSSLSYPSLVSVSSCLVPVWSLSLPCLVLAYLKNLEVLPPLLIENYNVIIFTSLVIYYCNILSSYTNFTECIPALVRHKHIYKQTTIREQLFIKYIF